MVPSAPIRGEVQSQTLVSAPGEVERLYREQGARLWWAILAFSGDPEVASDAVGEAFAQALRRGDAIRVLQPWVWRAAFRLAAGEMKRRRSLVPLAVEVDLPMPEETRTVVVALARLPHKQRRAIVLYYYGDYSLREIAQITGSAPATIAVHLSRARKRLRSLLQEEMDDD